MSEKKEKKPKKAKKKAETVDEHIRLSTHPGAAAAVKRVRARCGLGAFLLVGVLCLHAGLPAFEAVFRALVAGIVAHIAGWFVAIAFWRQVIREQAAQAAQAYNDRIRKAHLDAAERASAALNAQAAAQSEAEAQWAATIGS
jgi:triphosphoribosyl-dephospho-CoA synthetase